MPSPQPSGLNQVAYYNSWIAKNRKMFRRSSSSKSIHSHHLLSNHQPNNQNTNQPKSLLKSKSLLYRNRSLKQFFGDLPALNNYPQAPKPQPNCKEKQNAKRSGRGVYAQKGRKEIIEDEYLIKRREKAGKANKPSREQGLNSNLNHESKYKRNDIVDNEAEANTHRTQTHSHFYDPSPYQWRKSKSKAKHQRQPTQPLPQNQPLIVQSQYYPTPKSSRNYQGQFDSHPARQQARSNSSDSTKKGRESHLKPRVAKHIFQRKAVKKKSEEGDKRLLFTFGI